MYLLGFDIGGGHIGSGLVLENGGELIVHHEEGLPGISDLSAKSLVKKLYEMYKILIKKINKIDNNNNNNNISLNDINAIGIGCPGQSCKGVLVAAANLPTLRNVPLASMVSDMFNGIYCTLLNDADAAMAAELWAGQGPKLYGDVNNAVMLTLGTGIGSALLINGKLHEGTSGLIEAGHLILNTSPQGRLCGCGQNGCAETYSSAFNTALRMNESLIMQETSQDTGSDFPSSSLVKNAKQVFNRAAKGDRVAMNTLQGTMDHLAVLCINICRVIDPEVIILAGGMAQAGEELLKPLKRRIQKRSWTILPTDVRVVCGQSIDHQGIVGAALAASLSFRTAAGDDVSIVSSLLSSASPIPGPSSIIDKSNTNNSSINLSGVGNHKKRRRNGGSSSNNKGKSSKSPGRLWLKRVGFVTSLSMVVAAVALTAISMDDTDVNAVNISSSSSSSIRNSNNNSDNDGLLQTVLKSLPLPSSSSISASLPENVHKYIKTYGAISAHALLLFGQIIFLSV